MISAHILKCTPDMKGKKAKRKKKPFLFKLTNRISFFLLLMVLFLLALYSGGSVQDFSDVTQTFLLFSCSAVALALLIFSLAGAFQSLLYTFVQRKLYFLIFFLLYILSCAFSAVLFVLLRVISTLSKGF